MDKIRIIIFGATEISIGIVRRGLLLENVSVVAFSDNNLDKCGVVIDNIPVIHSSKITDYHFEYVLISAWRSYDIIRKQLISLGVPERKIDLLYTEKVPYLYQGSICICDRMSLGRIYRYSDLIFESIQKSKEITEFWKEYTTWKPMQSDQTDWCCKGTMIAHACGGTVNGMKRMYSNSKEALADSLQKGFRLIECDAYGVINGEVILAHDDIDLYDGYQKAFSLLTFDELWEMLRWYPDVNILVDIKWRTQQDYERIVDAIDNLVDHDRKQQIILEVYNEPSIIYAKTKGYDCFYTQYRNPEAEFFIKTVAMCYKYGIKAVGFPLETALAPISNYFNIFMDKNIKIFVYSTDSIDEYALVRSKGISGVFTNYLYERTQNEYSTHIGGRSGSEDA